MKNKLALAIATLTLVGCGKVVEVPPAYVGKLSTSSGLQEGVIQPSKLRLTTFCWVCDNLILAQASDYPVKESMTIFMPQDKLNLTADVRGTFSIDSSEQNVSKIFSRMSSQATHDSRVSVITIEQVYQTYAMPVVRDAVRAVLTKYEIMGVMENRAAISDELEQTVRSALKNTPVTVLRFGLADLQPPTIIVKAQEAATEREIGIRRAEADKLVKLKEAEASLEVAFKQQEVDLKEAETQVLVAKKLAQGVSPAWVTQRAIKALEKLENGNHVILMPTEAFTNPAMLVGVTNKALSVKK